MENNNVLTREMTVRFPFLEMYSLFGDVLRHIPFFTGKSRSDSMISGISLPHVSVRLFDTVFSHTLFEGWVWNSGIDYRRYAVKKKKDRSGECTQARSVEHYRGAMEQSDMPENMSLTLDSPCTMDNHEYLSSPGIYGQEDATVGSCRPAAIAPHVYEAAESWLHADDKPPFLPDFFRPDVPPFTFSPKVKILYAHPENDVNDSVNPVENLSEQNAAGGGNSFFEFPSLFFPQKVTVRDDRMTLSPSTGNVSANNGLMIASASFPRDSPTFMSSVCQQTAIGHFFSYPSLSRPLPLEPEQDRECDGFRESFESECFENQTGYDGLKFNSGIRHPEPSQEVERYSDRFWRFNLGDQESPEGFRTQQTADRGYAPAEGSAPLVTNNIHSLVDHFEIHTTNLGADLDQVRDQVVKVLQYAVNDFNIGEY